MKFDSDIDIDVGDRTQFLEHLKHIPAAVIRDGALGKHNSGIHITEIPVDPLKGCATLEFVSAQDRGYIKLDLLNVGVYQQVRGEQHLQQLMNTEPPWDRLYDPAFCSKLIHVGRHYNSLISMPEAVNSIPRLAMFLAIIRPAKKHLIGLPWKEVAKTIWEKPTDGTYGFKMSHSLGYAHLVAVHCNLLNEQDPLKHVE